MGVGRCRQHPLPATHPQLTPCSSSLLCAVAPIPQLLCINRVTPVLHSLNSLTRLTQLIHSTHSTHSLNSLTTCLPLLYGPAYLHTCCSNLPGRWRRHQCSIHSSGGGRGGICVRQAAATGHARAGRADAAAGFCAVRCAVSCTGGARAGDAHTNIVQSP